MHDTRIPYVPIGNMEISLTIYMAFRKLGKEIRKGGLCVVYMAIGDKANYHHHKHTQCQVLVQLPSTTADITKHLPSRSIVHHFRKADIHSEAWKGNVHGHLLVLLSFLRPSIHRTFNSAPGKCF